MRTSKADEARLEQTLEDLGALSVTLADAADEPILELGPGETRLWQQMQLSALFEADADPAAITQALRDQLGEGQASDLSFESLQDQPWERAWLEHFRPMRFGHRLWICPSGQRVEAADALIIDLDPGLAFGTGTHPTTALCLEWLDGADLQGREVLDFGCGSGILAIAALKLGAAWAHALDHDPQAIQASADNARNNRVIERLRLYAPGELPQSPVGLIVANILSGTLIKLQPTLTQLAQPGAELLLSGILQEQAEAVLEAYRPHFQMQQAASRDGWVLLHGVRSD
ncbi:MAG: 50S ribosomal protein L11 methyltransferase [Gammaproteobacteria bacterium SHHR-1]